MSKYIEKVKKLRESTALHYNCAQSVILPFAAEAGLDEESAFKLTDNFGSGMRMGSVCGAFTGGLMVLGLFGINTPGVIAAYTRKVKENHEGLINCSDLLKRSHERGEIKKEHCDGMVYENVAIVEEILREHRLIQ